jgi:hypothetical protein
MSGSLFTFKFLQFSIDITNCTSSKWCHSIMWFTQWCNFLVHPNDISTFFNSMWPSIFPAFWKFETDITHGATFLYIGTLSLATLAVFKLARACLFIFISRSRWATATPQVCFHQKSFSFKSILKHNHKIFGETQTNHSVLWPKMYLDILFSMLFVKLSYTEVRVL